MLRILAIKMKIPKIIYRQMPAPQDLPQKSPQKLGCKSPRMEANFRYKSPGGARGE